MSWLSHLRQLLATLVVAGLALAPLAGPVATAAPQAMTDTGLTDMGLTDVGLTDVGMGDMPCCPPVSGPDDCQKCPLIGLCLAKCFQGQTRLAALPAPRLIQPRALKPGDDQLAESLAHAPPARPPRSLDAPA